jgi:AbrB family looped-hinge helix DNA binding protein
VLVQVGFSEVQNEPRAPKNLEAEAVIGEKGRMVIPAALREALGLKPGDAVDLRIENHELHISTRWSRMKRAQERAQRHFEPGRVLSDELSAERRATAQAE